MRIVISALILISLLAACYAENPGLVAVVKLPIINKIKDKYFETAFQSFGHQNLPDFSSGDLSVSNIVVDMANTSPANLKLAFVSEKNAMGIEIDQTSIVVNVHWHYKKSIISVSGDAKISGTINSIGMNLGLTKLQSDSFFVPQVSVMDFSLGMDKGAFSLDFHCDHCPGEIEKIIGSILKDQLIDQVRDQIQSQVPNQINQIGNQVLASDYPTTFNMYQNFGIATGLSDSILVAADHLELPLDATFFAWDKGFSRPATTPDMPHYNPNDPGEIMMFFNPYLVSTLSDTINTGVQTYTDVVMGIQYDVSLDPALGQTTLGFEEGDLVVTATPTIIASAYGVGIRIGATAKLDPKISNGDDQNMFSVTPKIKTLALSSLAAVYNGTTLDLSFAVDYLNAVITGFLNQLVIPTIPIAKREILPLHVTNSELDFHSTYGEFGILFDFGRY